MIYKAQALAIINKQKMFTSYKPFIAIGTVLTALTQAVEQETAASKLPYLNADPNSVTISGTSSGAHFSCNLMIILSGTIKGAGCAKGGAFMHDWKNDFTADEIKTRATGWIDDLALDGDIDPLENLANNAAFVISGLNDAIMPP